MFERLNGHDSEETPAGSMAFFRETIGVGEDRFAEYEDHEAAGETLELETPFLGASATSFGATGELSAPEIAALCEMTAELKDGAFRESLEQLAEEALEIHAQQLTGEYGDHEVREANALRVLEDHFRPIATQAEQMLDRFFERLEQSEAAALSPGEIERIAGEVLPTSPGFSPAAEQFFGTLLRKASKLVDMAKRGVAGAVKLASTGLAAVGKLALGPLLEPLKKLATFLLRHVARYALDHIPPPLRPLAQQLSDRLFQALGAHEAETEDHAHAAAEVPASVDAARLEAEFDLELAQLMLTPDANEVDHLVANYGEAEAGPSPLAELDQTRAQFANALQRLEPGQSAGPVMEQFLPALLWPAAKAALAMMGRPKFVGYIARLLDGLMKPMIGEKGAGMLAPAIADAGLRAFGLEMSESDPRAVAAEAMAAAVEETVNSLSELPPYVMENETLLETAVREAFETAAATYFPPSVIRPDLRETAGRQGVWTRMPAQSSRKRYARYTETPHVAISPRVAAGVPTFGGATLRDHLRDRMNIADGRTVKTNIRLYQVTPGTTAAQIARAEGFHSHDLHPLTREAAGALLGHDAGLGSRHTPARYLHSPHRLHVRQRLYYVEPPGGRPHRHRRHHGHHARSELLINLTKGEIRVWLHLSEPLCQRMSAELAKPRNAAAAFRLVKPLVHRAAEMLRGTLIDRHLPPELRVVSDAPNLDAGVPPWLAAAGNQLAAKIEEWASRHVAGYLEHSGEDFRRLSAENRHGLTFRLTMTRIPGIEKLRLAAQGRDVNAIQGAAWLDGTPAIVMHIRPGHAIR